MSLYQGGTTIDAVYLGAGASGTAQKPVVIGGRQGNSTLVLGTETNQVDDLFILVWQRGGASVVGPAPTPAGWTYITHLDKGAGAGAPAGCTVFYKWATSTAWESVTLPGREIWGTYTIRGVDKASAATFGTAIRAYWGTPMIAPALTAGQPGTNVVLQMFTIYTPVDVLLLYKTVAGYTRVFSDAIAGTTGNAGMEAYSLNDTSASAIPQLTNVQTTTSNMGWGFSLELKGGVPGVGLAQAVYLGDLKVWPIYVASQSPWYSPPANNSINVPWPKGAEFCDVIMIGGGAGGDGTGIGGGSQNGGGSGPWAGSTIPRVEGGLTYDSLSIFCHSAANQDGVGGGNFNTAGANGSWIEVTPKSGTQNGSVAATGYGARRGSNTGNRNGGNVAPTFTFNGRTYTVASYGAGAGQGGASSNKNGSDAARPGGGGQSADRGGLTGYDGGNGAHGAAILYWY